MRCGSWLSVRAAIGGAAGLGLLFLPGWFKMMAVAAVIVVSCDDVISR